MTQVTSPDSFAPKRRLSDFLGPILALVALLGMGAWSWGRLVDIQVDFGRELYLPWQLASGKRLYADLIYYYGPLSPYFNALLFKLFGTSLRTLMVGNLVITGAIAVVLYHLLRGIADAFSASVACLVFVLVFACADYGPPDIFNYICPYSHPATHGLLLGLASVLLAGRVNLSPTLGNSVVCGIAIGLTFLTKPELFVAATVATLLCLGLTVSQYHLTRRRTLVLLAAWLTGAVLVVLATFLALCLLMSPRTAFIGVLGSWPHLKNQGSSLFYKRIMGTDQLHINLMILLRTLLWYGTILIPLALYAPSRRNRLALLSLGLGSLGSAIQCNWPDLPNPFFILRPLPVFLVAVAIGFGVKLIRRRDSAEAQGLIRKLVLIVFAGLLLARIALNTSVLHYGFTLAVPGTMLLIVACLEWLPAWAGAATNRPVHTGAVLGILMLWIIVSLALFKNADLDKYYVVGNGADTFRGDQRCRLAAPLLVEIRERLRPGESLCVLPEGLMINYLAKVESSVPFDCFIPPALEMFGENRIVESFRAHPPDYVILVHRETPEYGVSLFGRDYGRELYSWVMQHYGTVAEYGRDPMTEGGDGLILMARRRVLEDEGSQTTDRGRQQLPAVSRPDPRPRDNSVFSEDTNPHAADSASLKVRSD